MKKSVVEQNPAEECYLCGSRGYLERHHIFGGPNRKLSEKYGLTVHLCWMDHQDSREGVHHNRERCGSCRRSGSRHLSRHIQEKISGRFSGGIIWKEAAEALKERSKK